MHSTWNDEQLQPAVQAHIASEGSLLGVGRHHGICHLLCVGLHALSCWQRMYGALDVHERSREKGVPIIRLHASYSDAVLVICTSSKRFSAQVRRCAAGGSCK